MGDPELPEDRVAPGDRGVELLGWFSPTPAAMPRARDRFAPPTQPGGRVGVCAARVTV